MLDPTYIVGIDLGTTNCVVAYAGIETAFGQTPAVRLLEIPQLTAPGVMAGADILPSCIYLPGPDDQHKSLALPWEEQPRLAVGEYARARGAEVPHRQIASAKSWLCYPQVDRNQAILPWDAAPENLKLSPVEATAAILSHIRQAWNHVMASTENGLADHLLLEHQDIFLTVPASFDAVARELTVQAASAAGLPKVVLLEEPQAAFYAWIEARGEAWRKAVREGNRILVCDVGGGTTDFSLIDVSAREGELVLERVAVGEHLLVGGDNMDLALAHRVAARLAQTGRKLSPWQMRGLWHACRTAKEHLLQESSEQTWPLTILGRGRSLIGGSLRTELSFAEVQETLLEGFFPTCEIDTVPHTGRSTGIRELGLNYAADPAVTHHLAAFIQRHCTDGRLPDHILFNGGVMKPHLLRTRILELLNTWHPAAGQTAVQELTSFDLDRSVARGAVYYGLATRGNGIRIRAGLNRTYYIGVAASLPAVPGLPTPLKALCVAPFGMEEGTHLSLPQRQFMLVVGEPVKFDFLGSTIRLEDAAGTLIEDWNADIEEITTLETILKGEAGAVVPVTLEVHATEVGTLELWCVAQDERLTEEGVPLRWKLDFNVREQHSVIS